MAELRYNPLIKDWVMIASHRQNRPQMPKEECPFCPGSGKVPEHYDVLKYDNDFPALSVEPPVSDQVQTDFFKTKEAYGKCEVILYSPEHTATLPELPVGHITKIVNLWGERFEEISKDPKIKYIFIFENRGEVIGVTMPHPHGQIYGYPFIPKKLELELSASSEFFKKNKKCLFCEMIREEKAAQNRVIFENEDFIVFLPFFSEYPYGIYLASKKHLHNITELDEPQRMNLAMALRDATGTLDALFEREFPYMMCMHQAPVNGSDENEHYHFHIEFISPVRSKNKLKYNASSESGAWAHCNPTAPEEKAEELRRAYNKYKSGLEVHGQKRT